MSQSALVVGLLGLAFVLYVTARGRLPTYTGVLWGPAPSTTGGTSDASQANKPKPDLIDPATALNLLEMFAEAG